MEFRTREAREGGNTCMLSLLTFDTFQYLKTRPLSLQACSAVRGFDYSISGCLDRKYIYCFLDVFILK